VRHVEEPLSEYVRWELLGYVESQAAGERIFIDHRPDMTAMCDFWLFDGDDPADRYAILMHYDDAGSPVEFEYRDDEEGLVTWLQVKWDVALGAAPLNHYLAPRSGVTGAA
jgi:hypothetical protein